LSPGVKKIVDEERGVNSSLFTSVGANDALIPLFVIAVSPLNVDGALRELAFRIEGLLGGHAVTPQAPGENFTTVGELVIDQHGQRVWVGGEGIFLTRLELKLVVALMNRRDKVYPRPDLLREVWSVNSLIKTRTVDTHVKRLRTKLRSAGRFIQTVRGIGYRFSEVPSPGPVFVRRSSPNASIIPRRA
jgi:DNA-binding winged helix-turn-helix (wHTH) protein